MKEWKQLEVNEIWEFLKNLSLSYSNFVKINFAKKFSSTLNFDEKRTNTAASKLLNLSSLRVVALEYRSFSFGVSADKIMGRNEIENKSISEWRNNLINDFNNEVIDIDFDSNDIQKLLFEKYEKEEIKSIYYPIVKSINNNSNYTIAITNKNFSPKRKLKRISTQTLKSVFPKAENEIDEKSGNVNFIRTVIPVDNSKNIIKINVSSLTEDNLFTQRFEEIPGKLEEINLSFNDKFLLIKPIEFTLSHNPFSGNFKVHLKEIDLIFNIENFNHLQREFDEQMKKLILLP